jgi:peptidyl-prolyl cis-trans isomerase SurA
LFNDFVNDNCLAYENKHLEDNYPEFKALMREYHDGILLFDLTDKKVWTKAVKDTLGLEAYFNDHNTQYMWNERVDATVYQLKNKDDFDTIMAIIKAYDNDGDIAKKFDTDSINSVKIIPGKFEKGDNKYVDLVKWTADNIEVIPSDVEKKVNIVKVKSVLPPQMKNFNEARGIATADYQGYLEENWIKELKTKYPVEINQEVLQLLTSTQ